MSDSRGQAVRQYRRALAGDTGIYALVHSAGFLEAVLTVPLLAAILSEPSLAFLGAIEGAMILVLSLSQLGVKFSYLQFAADRAGAPRGDLLGTCILLVGAAGFLAALAGAAMVNGLAEGLLSQPDTVAAAALCWTAVAANIHMMLVTQLRSIRRTAILILFNYLQAIVNAGGIWLLAGQLQLGVDGVFYAKAAALTVAAACLAAVILPQHPLRWAPDLVMPLLRYGIPLMVGGLLRYSLEAAFRWLLVGLGETAAAAAYTLIARIAAIFDTLFGTPVLMAWGGIIYPLLARADLAAIVRPLLRDLLLASSLVAAAIILSAYWLLPDSSADAALGLSLLPLAVLGRQLFTLQMPLAAGFLAQRQSGWSVRYNCLGLVLFLLSVPATLALAGPVAGLAAAVAADGISLALLGWRAMLALQRAPGRAPGAAALARAGDGAPL